jgi:hypothetical protein
MSRRDLQLAADPDERGSGDPIFPALVFLDLLKTQSDSRAKLCLAETMLDTKFPNLCPELNVNRV